MSTQRRHWATAPRFTPLLGVLIGAAGGGVYWLGAQIWPTSIAVVLAMLATALLSASSGAGSVAGARTLRS
jgi:cobalamin synthase